MIEPLRLMLLREPDGTGELSAQVHINGFSGVGAAWFNLAEIKEFGSTLASSFPLLPERSYELKGGNWSTTEPAVVEQVHLGISFYPFGLLGKVGCRVHLSAQDTTNHVAKHKVTVELLTQYEQLRQFGIAVVALAEGEMHEAILSIASA